MRPADTTEEAHHVQLGIWRRMTAEEKLRQIFECSDLVRASFESGIRTRHPEYSDQEVRLARIRHELGNDLYQQAYPDMPLLAP